MYICICETMPCVDTVFMYSMLVVASDSWWSIPLNVRMCAVWSYPFQVEEGVYVPFAVHANLTLDVCEGTCSLLA